MVLTRSEIPRFKQMGKRKDSRALMVVHDMLEVMGHRIGKRPHQKAGVAGGRSGSGKGLDTRPRTC